MTEEKRIVVLGGAFNPPTRAHAAMMERAMRAVRAERGIFVPIGDIALREKMRGCAGDWRLDEGARMAMLTAVCAGREGWAVSDIEIENPQLLCARDTMWSLKLRNPGAALWFAAGADKLPMLRTLAAETDFFEHFGVALFSREGVDVRTLIGRDAVCARHADAFAYAALPEDAANISATAVRGMIARGDWDGAAACLDTAVLGMLRDMAETKGELR